MADREDVEDAQNRLQRFQAEHFSGLESEFRDRWSSAGRTTHALFIGCSDSRVVPHLLLGAEPGDLFVMRNVGAIVPPYDGRPHATGAAIEYAVLALGVRHICVCTHSHCGAMAALYREPESEPRTSTGGSSTRARRSCRWPESEDVLRRTEQRMVASVSSGCSAIRWWPRRSRAGRSRCTGGTT